MKYINGMWNYSTDYNVFSTMSFYEHKVVDNKLYLYLFLKHSGAREAINGGMITIIYEAINDDSFKVNLYHYKLKSEQTKLFATKYEAAAPTVVENDNKIEFINGRSKLVFDSEILSTDFYYDGEKITSCDSNSAKFIKDVNTKEVWMKNDFELAYNEKIYGFGERFTNFVKNGQSVKTWNADGGTASEQAYKSIPFYISSKNYGLFVNDSRNVEYEIGSSLTARLQYALKSNSMEYFIFLGSNPKEIVKKYVDLTGQAPKVENWTYGLWLSTSFVTKYDEKTVLEFINKMEECEIYIDVFHFDCFWMKGQEWMNFEWNPEIFPDAENMLKKIHEKGIKVCVWINPYIAQKSKWFDYCDENDFLIKTGNGDAWQWDFWQAGMGIVDFTNPEATKWYKEQLKTLLRMGVDSFKTDFGERIPENNSEFFETEEIKFFDDTDPSRMHNYYTYLYNKAVFEAVQEEKPEELPCLFARSGTTGSQQFPVHWGGDCLATYDSMAESLKGGLSLGLAGFPYWSHDIGGFESGCEPDIYKRWTQFGLLSSHSRYHGLNEYKVPWLYGEEAVVVTRRFTNLKRKLLPYLLKTEHEAQEQGTPFVRPMFLEYPKDIVCQNVDLQYFFGSDLLVCPIFNNKGQVDFYVPEGKWINILTSEEYKGETYYNQTYDYLNLPLLMKAGTYLVTSNGSKNMASDLLDDFTIYTYEVASDVSYEIYMKDEIIKFDSSELEQIQAKHDIKISIKDIYEFSKVSL